MNDKNEFDLDFDFEKEYGISPDFMNEPEFDEDDLLREFLNDDLTEPAADADPLPEEPEAAEPEAQAEGDLFDEPITDDFLNDLLRGIGDVFVNIGNWLKENVVDPFVNGFKSLFDIHSPSKLMSGLGGHGIGGFLGGILDGLRGIGNWINQHVITPFVNGFKALRNGAVDIVEGMVNSIIRGINKLLSGLNEFLDLGKHVGLDLSIPTIPEVKLPRAAKGTIVSKATNLTVGEDGTEAIMPLERHTEWIDVLASKLAAKTGGTPGGGGGGSAIIQIFLGNRKVTEHVIKDINQITRENGVCPIHV